MKSPTSVIKIKGERHLPRQINKLAITAACLAIILIVIIIATFISADKMMRSEVKPLTDFSGNVLPNYRLITFPSLDEQTTLSGWLFPAKEEAISTIILVHDKGANRLQFELDTPPLYELLVNNGFNVIAFDLRHSGKSKGSLSTYGYGEWADVLAAIQYAQKHTETSDVILYGFGSGVSTALMACQELPTPAQAEKQDKDGKINNSLLKNITFDRSYIRALILDTPSISPDDYIKADCRQNGFWGRNLLQHTVPYAIRLSAGHSGIANLITIISQQPIPVFITWAKDDQHLSQADIEIFTKERQKLYPDLTYVQALEASSYLGSWKESKEEYTNALEEFLAFYVRKS